MAESEDQHVVDSSAPDAQTAQASDNKPDESLKMSGALADEEGAKPNAEGDKPQATEDEESKDTETGTGNDKDSPRRSTESKRFVKNYKSPKGHIRSKFDNLPETDDPEEIRRQVEFYFSDANLPMDNFLRSATGGSENKPFPLKELHTFKRMKRFQPYSAVLEAVKASKVLNVNDDGEVSRKEPLSEDYTDDAYENRRIHDKKVSARTVYIKGFGPESETTQTEIEEFFAPYGEISAVRLRRREEDKSFKGSVTVEFATEAEAKDLLNLADKPKWKGERKLDFLEHAVWAQEKADYEAARAKDRRNGKGNDRYNDKGFGGRGRGRGGRGGRGDRNGGGRDRYDRNGGGRDRNDRRGKRDRDDEEGEEGGDRDNWRQRRERDNQRDKRPRGDNSPGEGAGVETSGEKPSAEAGAEKTGEDSTKRAREEDKDGATSAEPEAKKAKQDTTAEAEA